MASLKEIETARLEVNAARAWVNSVIIERRDIVDALFASFLAKEHVLLLGPPGTAKTELAVAFASTVGVDDVFIKLLHKFSGLDEIFGPIKISGLEHDSYARKLSGLATARICVLDEIFKCNQALLNSLLTAINERKFDDDGQRIDIPLEFVLGASNEMPEDETLAALFDRFVLRFPVDKLSSDGLSWLLSKDLNFTNPPRVSEKSVAVLREEIKNFLKSPPPDVVAALVKISRDKGTLSDRRMKKMMKIAASYIAGLGDSHSSAINRLWPAVWERPDETGLAQAIVVSVSSKMGGVVSRGSSAIDQASLDKAEGADGWIRFWQAVKQAKNNREIQDLIDVAQRKRNNGAVDGSKLRTDIHVNTGTWDDAVRTLQDKLRDRVMG